MQGRIVPRKIQEVADTRKGLDGCRRMVAMSVAIDRRGHLSDPVAFKRFYDWCATTSTFEMMPLWEPRLTWTLEHILETDDVVDIGCDKGHMTVQIWARTVGRVVGVELAESSVAWNQENLDVDVEWVAAWAEHLPFPDNSFDVAVLCEILEHVMDPAVVIAEAERVVRPGGRVIISVPVDAEEMEHSGKGFEEQEFDGHVREYQPAIELHGKKDLKTCIRGVITDPTKRPFKWRMAVYTVE